MYIVINIGYSQLRTNSPKKHLMDIEILTQNLLKEAGKLYANFNDYCLSKHCPQCDFFLDKEHCFKLQLFIALCNGYALGIGSNIVVNNIDKMLKDLFPNFYEYISKQLLQPQQ